MNRGILTTCQLYYQFSKYCRYGIGHKSKEIKSTPELKFEMKSFINLPSTPNRTGDL